MSTSTSDRRNTIRAMPKEKILFRLLTKQTGYYQQILDIAEQEALKLKNRRPPQELVPLMKRKKILMECIAEIDSALQPIKKYWQSHKQDQGPLATEVRVQLEQLEVLLKEILELDASNQQVLKQYTR